MAAGVKARLGLGAFLWLAFAVYTGAGPLAVGWAHALLLLGPLVVVPIGLELAWGAGGGPLARVVRVLQLPAAALVAGAYVLGPGARAAVLVLPWLLIAGLIALTGVLRALQRFRHHRFPPIADVSIDAGLVYLAVGAAWATADRAGVRPLDFSPDIVLLTAIHFHFAGFALPIATGLAARRLPGWPARLAAAGVIVGVPFVAVGITATQLGRTVGIEILAAWLMAAAGVLSAWVHLDLAGRSVGEAPASARLLWNVAAPCLLFSMVLAALYGARYLLPVPWLDIPWMRALHGTANALGFAVAGLTGWLLAER
jgi:hypothetical protein